MVMMLVEVLLSVGALCDKVVNLKVYVRKYEFSLSYCHDTVNLNGIHLGRWTSLKFFLPCSRRLVYGIHFSIKPGMQCNIVC